MNTKNILIWIVILLVIVIGGFLIYTAAKSPAATAQNGTTNGTTASSTQVQAQEVAIGTGTEAKPGDTVSVLYVGQLSDGTVFDSSAAHGNQPLTFTLGTEGLIPGFQIGVNGMKVGGERLLAIPPALGYGAADFKDASGTVIIPGGSTLIFDVKLVGVTPATSTPATNTAE